LVVIVVAVDRISCPAVVTRTFIAAVEPFPGIDVIAGLLVAALLGLCLRMLALCRFLLLLFLGGGGERKSPRYEMNAPSRSAKASIIRPNIPVVLSGGSGTAARPSSSACSRLSLRSWRGISAGAPR
jgi:hypothetical protein